MCDMLLCEFVCVYICIVCVEWVYVMLCVSVCVRGLLVCVCL